jgi:hypothetical protein
VLVDVVAHKQHWAATVDRRVGEPLQQLRNLIPLSQGELQ